MNSARTEGHRPSARTEGHRPSARATAMKAEAVTYKGDPCDQCACTERYTKSASCLRCTRARAKRRQVYGGPLTDPAQLRSVLGKSAPGPTASGEHA